MDSAKVDEYLSEIPLEIRNSLKPLSKDKALAIYIAILKHDELKFNEIKKCFSTSSSGEINRYLKELSRAGLIKKSAKNITEIGIKEKACYQPTNMGKSLIRGVLGELLVKPNLKRARKEISSWQDSGEKISMSYLDKVYKDKFEPDGYDISVELKNYPIEIEEVIS